MAFDLTLLWGRTEAEAVVVLRCVGVSIDLQAEGGGRGGRGEGAREKRAYFFPPYVCCVAEGESVLPRVMRACEWILWLRGRLCGRQGRRKRICSPSTLHAIGLDAVSVTF